ncbi:MAG: hypothetical protein QHG99_05905 [Methanomicrobiales archaeon]|nr:hypothetical protein [Methanomicrobiales archaeon]
MTGEEALSPVVAVMLILAIVITFFTLFNATVVPAMKEQSEMEHLERVKEAFGRFDTDVHISMAMEGDVTLKERIPLGGGDVLVNTIRSGGTLRVQELAPLFRVTIDDTYNLYAGMVEVSYQPVSNFWQDQGYNWQYGYLNVTKHNGRVRTPLEYPRMEDVSLEGFANSTVSIARGADGNCTLRYVNLTKGDSDFASGNGHALLRLDALAVLYNASGWVNITYTGGAGAPEAFGNITPRLEGQFAGCSNILSCSYNNDTKMLAIQVRPPFTVAERHIKVSAG